MGTFPFNPWPTGQDVGAMCGTAWPVGHGLNGSGDSINRQTDPQPREHNLAEIDDDWEQLPIAELHEFDALCDRFEQTIVHDPQARIEPFVADLLESQQRLGLTK